MGAETELGSLALFMAVWVPMMAAMMLPGAVAAFVRFARATGRTAGTYRFAASYLLVWSATGLLVYALYRPHGTTAAGVLTLAAGLYELTPFKRNCRQSCRTEVRSGTRLGLACVGSSGGLMLILVALGTMSVTWMCIVGAVVLVQKLLPPISLIDMPLALAIVVLGAVVIVAPSVIPGLTPTM